MSQDRNVRRWGRRQLKCPSCHNTITASKLIFVQGLPCGNCGSILRASKAYLQTLVLLSCVLGFFLVWAAGIRSIVLISLLGLPTGFLLATIAVPIALWLIPPALVTSEVEHLTRLGLGHHRPTRDNE